MNKLSDKTPLKKAPTATAPLPADLNDTGCAASEPFALRVIGDSMEPEFKDGCIIIIDPSAAVEHGSFVVVETGDGPIFRQLIIENKRPPERLLLQPLNAGYEAEPLENRRAIIGVVVQRSGTRRSEHKHYV